MEKVTIYEHSGKYDLYDEAGGMVEEGFETQEEAARFCKDNDLKLVETFFV